MADPRFPVRRSPSPSSVSAFSLSRRALLRGATAGGAALAGGSLLASCAPGATGGSNGGSGGNTLQLGSNASDEVPRESMKKMVAAFEKQSDFSVDINTVSHNDFQTQIAQYLQAANPDDVLTWFAGNRMRFFAAQDLLLDVSDLWEEHLGAHMSEAFKKASTAEDGKQYFVPWNYYWWGVFYRPSLFQEKGYEPPETWDDFLALAKRMDEDGLLPFTQGDQGGWPAMGWFDYLNLRTNGYDFHIRLLEGKESFDSSEVRDVFARWREVLPYMTPDPVAYTWQQAATPWIKKEAGMCVVGKFITDVMPEDQRDDVDFFPFPEIDSGVATAVDAPIDGFIGSANAGNEKGAKELLRFFGGPEAQTINVKVAQGLGPNDQVDPELYGPLVQKGVEYVNSVDNIAQFFDRDSSPAFASAAGKAFQKFLNSPDDLDSILSGLQNKAEEVLGQ